MLSHRAAGALQRFRSYTPGGIEVLSHRWRRARPDWLTVHESLRLEEHDCTVEAGIPTTNRVRTIIDLGAVSHPYYIGLALDEERRRGNLTLDEVECRLEDLAVQGRPGIRTIRELIDVRRGKALGTTSFEDLLLDIVSYYHLPQPEQQWMVTDGDFVAYLDFAYPDHRLAIEADSEHYHLDLHAFHHDRSRQNRLSLLGWTFLRFTPTHLRHERLTVARQICSALGLGHLPARSSR